MDVVDAREALNVLRREIREAIFGEQDITILPVPTPEWPSVNGKVFVRSLSARQREIFLDSISKVDVVNHGNGAQADIKVFKQQSSLKLVVMTACDEHGELIFTMDDVEMLGDKSAVAMQRLIDATGDLNGFSDKAKDNAKNVSASVTVEQSSVSSTV